MQKWYGIGNLTNEVNLRKTQSGKSVASFGIAINGYNGVDYFTVNVWGNLAESCNTYLSKGKKVAIVGELHNRSYEDKDGNKRTVCEITASDIEYLTPKIENKEETRRPKLTEINDRDLPF